MQSDETGYLTALLVFVILVGLLFLGNVFDGGAKYFSAFGGLLIIVFSIMLLKGKRLGLVGLLGSLIALIVVIP